MGGMAHHKNKTDYATKYKSLKIEFNKMLAANVQLQKDLEAAELKAKNHYTKFLEVSSYCACKKKNGEF